VANKRSSRDVLLGFTLATALLAGCAPSDQETEFLARKAFLLRQNQGMRELIAEAEQGTLVPRDRFLVGIDERVLADVFRFQLPMERPLGKRFVVRLESATVLLRDKYGAITIEGEIHRPQTPQRRTRIRILGGLGGIKVDPRTHLLDVSIAIDRIELVEAGVLENVLGSGGKKFLAEKGRTLLQDALPTFHIPVALAQTIDIPAVEADAITLDSLQVPLDMSVERVIAAGGKLWVTLDAGVGKVTGAEEGLGVAVKKKPRKAKPKSGGGT